MLNSSNELESASRCFDIVDARLEIRLENRLEGDFESGGISLANFLNLSLWENMGAQIVIPVSPNGSRRFDCIRSCPFKACC